MRKLKQTFIQSACLLFIAAISTVRVGAATLTITSSNGNQVQASDPDAYLYNNQLFISPSLHTFSVTATASTGWRIYRMLYWTSSGVWLAFDLPNPSGNHTTWNFSFTYDFNYLRPSFASAACFATYRTDASGTYDLTEEVDIPLKVDSDIDGDGMADWWELKYFGTLGYGASDNYNGDYLTNLEEYRLGLNPTLQPGNCRDAALVGLQVFTVMQ